MKEPDRRTQQIRVFLNHRGEDTKNNFSMLLYNRLKERGINTFFDIKSMKPGEDLADRILTEIHECKVGVVVFSAAYCDSKSCLRELALMVELKKKGYSHLLGCAAEGASGVVVELFQGGSQEISSGFDGGQAHRGTCVPLKIGTWKDAPIGCILLGGWEVIITEAWQIETESGASDYVQVFLGMDAWNWEEYLERATEAIIEALKEVEAKVDPMMSFIHRMQS
ncbi:hypothetical protein Ancab_005255 [Ancistrocladus abbreviatus]